MNLHPQFIGQEGAEEYVVLPMDEFRSVTEALEDYQDLQDLRAAKATEGSCETTSLDKVIQELGLEND